MSQGDWTDQDFEDMDRWIDGYKPQQAARLPGPEALPVGSYVFEIVSAELTKTPKDPETIFRLVLTVCGGPYAGLALERPTFFRRQESIDFLGGDLVTLGLDAQQWGRRGKPWSAELRAAAPRLKGVRFSGSITESGQYRNLHVNALAARNATGPAVATPPAKPAPQPAPGPQRFSGGFTPPADNGQDTADENVQIPF